MGYGSNATNYPNTKFSQIFLNNVSSFEYALRTISRDFIYFFKFLKKDLFIIYLFILFIFGCAGSQLQHVGTSLRHVESFVCGVRALCCGVRVSCCGAWASLQLWRVGFLFSSCGTRVPECMGSVVCGTQALQLRRTSSVVVACGLSCPVACGILVP